MNFDSLSQYFAKIPAVQGSISSGVSEHGLWWIKFQIDIEHPLAWQVVQEIGHVANYLSLDDRLPTVFYPVSAPPYLNGGPKDYLHWIIESTDAEFMPDVFREWLEGRLPQPVDDLDQWDAEA